jgi:hypothetical protein
MPDAAQTGDWLGWERELRVAITALRDAGGHERVVRLLDHQATVAMHNAYCEQSIPFPGDRAPAG